MLLDLWHNLQQVLVIDHLVQTLQHLRMYQDLVDRLVHQTLQHLQDLHMVQLRGIHKRILLVGHQETEPVWQENLGLVDQKENVMQNVKHVSDKSNIKKK
jgi:hypothetical protein